MYCKNLLKRIKRNKPYFYCKELKQQIILSQCKNCLNRNVVRNSTIKNITTKRKLLENNRYSIFTNNLDKCYVCGKPKKDIHEIYGGSNRIRSIKNGFCLPLCRNCHQNEELIMELKIKMQKEYEKTHTRQEFIDIIGKNYIKE